jgi:hypothetical protein
MSSYINKRSRELGLKVVDARAPLVLGVTTSDVQYAQKKNPECCALARACMREYRGVRSAYFFRSAAWLEYPDRLVHYYLPVEVRKAIQAFDRTGAMPPGAYRLLKPPPTLRLGKAGKKARAEKAWGPRKAPHAAPKKGVRPLFQPKLMYLGGSRG